jgi:hypothetical protein
MATGDVNVPSELADQNGLLRHCENCNAEMRQLGELPALSIHAAMRIFRCYVCDHVVAEQA